MSDNPIDAKDTPVLQGAPEARTILAKQRDDRPIVVALVPAYNEEERIGSTVSAILSIPEVTRVVVIDDGSTDMTGQYANDAGARVIRSTRNVGKGSALEHAARQAEDANIVLLLDGDLADTAVQASLLLEPVMKGEIDMSIARFPRPEGKAGFGFVMGLARGEILRNGGREDQARAPLSGQRCLTIDCLDAVRPFARGYGAEVALTVRALQNNFRVTEVETTMKHAATGRDLRGFYHRGKQFRDVLITIVRLRTHKKNRHPRAGGLRAS
jgi:glycosyltransferase involved in cell wall biosynthesis